MSSAQAVLFDLVPAYWHRLRETQEKLMRAARSPNTVAAYAHTWKVFEGWCAGVGRSALPATSETVCAFAVWCLYERERRYRLQTVKLTLGAIAHRHIEQKHASPVTGEVRSLLRNAARDLRERKGGKEALMPAELRRLCAALQAEGSPISIRDRAMILMQFAAGWRCSEVTGLDLDDLRFTRQGFVITLGASKTDQDGSDGRIVGIEHGEHPATCPVKALREWLAIRGRWPGALFSRITTNGGILEHGLAGDAINHRLKIALAGIGESPQRYGSHSLRSGMVTTAIERGASETLIMMRTGHKSLESMRRYVRRGRIFRRNPLAGVL